MKQILLSIRMLLRFKVYTFVNFIGLAISLACVFTITRYIHQENTVDHCYPEYKRIYFIERSISDGTKELSGYQSDLEKDPAVERYASFTPCTDLVMDFGKQEITVNALSIDSTFFSIFPYSIYMGSGKIKRPNDALITKEFWLHSLNGYSGNQNIMATGHVFIRRTGRIMVFKSELCCSYDTGYGHCQIE